MTGDAWSAPPGPWMPLVGLHIISSTLSLSAGTNTAAYQPEARFGCKTRIRAGRGKRRGPAKRGDGEKRGIQDMVVIGTGEFLERYDGQQLGAGWGRTTSERVATQCYGDAKGCCGGVDTVVCDRGTRGWNWADSCAISWRVILETEQKKKEVVNGASHCFGHPFGDGPVDGTDFLV
ncbi:hypothetical protein IWX50DRAFT_620556 [Phyllosticta citricarpa]|uniref:Uncharacterized protein n=1 Tax=Phyllosticta citricarpa TaxID=55181 RepID=A0ABR1L5D7_9PEZI